jgi:hypothetical protein
MTIDGVSAQSFFLRILLSIGITAAVGVVAFFCIRWLSGAFQ